MDVDITRRLVSQAVRPVRSRHSWLGLVLVTAVVVALGGGRLRAQQPVSSYVVGPQDVLLISVFDQQDLGGKYTVDSDGSVSFPLIGRLKVGGLTLQQVEGALRTALA